MSPTRLNVEILVPNNYDEPEELNKALHSKLLDIANHFNGLESAISSGASNNENGKAAYKLEYINAHIHTAIPPFIQDIPKDE